MAGGKPSIPTAQRIACSQGLVCAEPTLRGSNREQHCPQPVTAASPQWEAEIWPFLQGQRVLVRLQP